MSKEASSPVAMGVDSRGFSCLTQESKRKHTVTSRRGQGEWSREVWVGRDGRKGRHCSPKVGLVPSPHIFCSSHASKEF